MRIMEKPQIKRGELAIIVIDMHNDFVSRGGKYLERDPSYYEPGHVDSGLLSLSRELKAKETKEAIDFIEGR